MYTHTQGSTETAHTSVGLIRKLASEMTSLKYYAVQTDKMENEKEMLFELKIQMKELKNNQNEQRMLFNKIR